MELSIKEIIDYLENDKYLENDEVNYMILDRFRYDIISFLENEKGDKIQRERCSNK
jgi:hypothetical protein